MVCFGATFVRSEDLLMFLFIVIPSHLQPPADETSPEKKSASKSDTAVTKEIPNHNYTICCQENNVSMKCLGFCSLQQILNGTTGQEPEECEADFPTIVKCMAGIY